MVFACTLMIINCLMGLNNIPMGFIMGLNHILMGFKHILMGLNNILIGFKHILMGFKHILMGLWPPHGIHNGFKLFFMVFSCFLMINLHNPMVITHSFMGFVACTLGSP
jgi:hypothetical protein